MRRISLILYGIMGKSGRSRCPVTAKIAGSNPAGPAIRKEPSKHSVRLHRQMVKASVSETDSRKGTVGSIPTVKRRMRRISMAQILWRSIDKGFIAYSSVERLPQAKGHG